MTMDTSDYDCMSDDERLALEVELAVARRLRAETLASEPHAPDEEAAVEPVKTATEPRTQSRFRGKVF